MQSSYTLDGHHSGVLLLCKLASRITKPTQERQLALVRLSSTRKPCKQPLGLSECLRWWEVHFEERVRAPSHRERGECKNQGRNRPCLYSKEQHINHDGKVCTNDQYVRG